MRSRHIVAAGLCALSPTLLAADAAPPRNLHELAVTLARQRVPSGVVVPEAALFEGAFRPDLQALTPTPVSLLIARFQAADPRFRAALEDGIVHVRSVDEPPAVRAALAREVYVEQDVTTTVIGAIYEHVLWAMSGRTPEGLVGSGAAPGPECPIGTRIRIMAGSTTVEGLLDAIPLQVPGFVWVVTYAADSPQFGLKVGFLCPDGSLTRLTVP